MRVRRTVTPRARKAPAGLPALLPALRSGRADREDVFRSTADDFLRMGAKLMSSYDLPPCVELEDVAQELRLRLIEALPKWDATRGKSLAEFVLFVAHSKTRKMLDAGREADRSTKESRTPLLLIDAVEAEEREALLAGGCDAEPTPEDVAAGQERIDLARKIAAAVGMTVDELVGVIDRDDVRERVREVVLDEVYAGGRASRSDAEISEEWT